MRSHFFVSICMAVVVLCASSALADDWPMYRRDCLRSAVAEGEIPAKMYLKWLYKSRQKPSPAWPPQGPLGKNSPLPTYDYAFQVVVSDNKLFYGSSSENKLVCLNAESGNEIWTYLTNAPVRFAPSISGSSVVFGSDDGVVRCLNTLDGALLWERLPIIGKRWLPGNNRFIYSAPIRTDIAVVGSTAHFGAGLFPETSISMGVWRCSVSVGNGANLIVSSYGSVAEGYLVNSIDTLGVSKLTWPMGKFISWGVQAHDIWWGAKIIALVVIL